MSAVHREADIFDYVIVGAGTAGCLLAKRLSEDGRYTIWLLEAGPPDPNINLHVPGGFIKAVTNQICLAVFYRTW